MTTFSAYTKTAKGMVSSLLSHALLISGLLLCFPAILHAQALIAQGSETPVSYSPPVAPLAANVPALNFSLVSPCTTPNCGPGANTFLLTVNPTVSARISITNETANACLGTFSISVFASAQNPVSFNAALQQWASIPLVTPTNALAGSIVVDLPALTTIYIESTAIAARSVAVQIVNTTGGCAATSIDATITFISVAVTTPLISNTNGGIFSGGLTANVQGITPPGANGAATNPVIGGTLQPAINAGFAALGIDTFSQPSTSITGSVGPPGAAFSFTGPAPSTNTDWALVVLGPFNGTVNTVSVPPWTCIEATCNNTGVNPLFLQLSPGVADIVSGTVTNAPSTYTMSSQFTLFTKAPTVRQHVRSGSLTPALAATLAGSTLHFTSQCVASCTVSGITDTQGLTWRLVQSTSLFSTWVAGPATAAVDTLTITMGAGVFNQGETLELSAITPASGNQPSAPLLSDTNKNLFVDSPNPIALSNAQSISTPITSSNTGAAAAITATIAGVTGKFSYLTGFQITGAGATAASVITVTVTGTISGTMSYNLAIPAGVTTSITPLVVTFSTPIPASATGVAIVVNVPSFGAGNTNSAVAAQGFQQ